MGKRPLEGKVAVVTGATRGIGKGIAVQLGEAGALVYVTGRTLKSKNNLGSLEETQKEIENRGGRCIPVQVDHEKDDQIVALFEKIEKEQNGQLDILVNNAYKGVEAIFSNMKTKFYEQSPEQWDEINNVGLRNHYFCTVYASRIMVKRNTGLIINISSFGGLRYLFNVPYGVGKAAVDRMAVDCGIELKKQNVAMMSLWPGPVKTELVGHLSEQMTDEKGKKATAAIFGMGESTEYSGKVIVKLATDPKIMDYTARIIIASDYANMHNVTDIDGTTIHSFRELSFLASKFLPESIKFIGNYIPGFFKIPQFLIDIGCSKF